MKEVVLSKPSSSSCESVHESDEEGYQVETVSTSSCQDYQDNDDYEVDGAIVVAHEPKLPEIGSVSVVNSNEVHIGNKTVYKGPVTIKQFLYPGSAVPSDGVSSLGESITNIDLSSPTSNGVDNVAFEKVPNFNKDNSDKKITIPNNDAQQSPSVRKGLLWLKNLPKHKTRTIVIFLSVLIMSLTIMIVVLYWRYQPEEVNNIYSDDATNESDNDTPIDYSSDSNATINRSLRMVKRGKWLAQPPTHPSTALKTPVPLILIQHTATESCISQAQCIFQVRNIQQFHIESTGWWDIAYNFLVGGDGAAYEGRGWTSEGSHTLGYNNISIGVGFIGTFTAKKPPVNQIVVFKKLIEKGVKLGYIKEDYKIIAARQVHATESPGAAFYKEIQTWPHWSKTP